MSAMSKQSSGDIVKVGQVILVRTPVHEITAYTLVELTVISLMAQFYLPKT
jgi:hypothetical protein